MNTLAILSIVACKEITSQCCSFKSHLSPRETELLIRKSLTSQSIAVRRGELAAHPSAGHLQELGVILSNSNLQSFESSVSSDTINTISAFWQ